MIITNWDTCKQTLLQGFSEFSSGAEQIWTSLSNNIIQPSMESIGQICDDLWEKHLKPLQEGLSKAIGSIGASLTTIWNDVLAPLADWLISMFGARVVTARNLIVGIISSVGGFLADIVGDIMLILDGLLQFIAGTFTGDWKSAWEGVTKVFEGIFSAIEGICIGAVNVIIVAINAAIGLIYSHIAKVVNGIGDIARVVGDMVGKDWGFSMPTKPPQIPYLAKGAVLPANRPFLAMVGDQRHGTNIEAPLATIQEAVAVVMEDMIASNLAGQEAIVGVLREILEAVLGIRIGDAVIAQAAERYQRKMAVVRGAMY